MATFTEIVELNKHFLQASTHCLCSESPKHWVSTLDITVVSLLTLLMVDRTANFPLWSPLSHSTVNVTHIHITDRRCSYCCYSIRSAYKLKNFAKTFATNTYPILVAVTLLSISSLREVLLHNSQWNACYIVKKFRQLHN